MEQNGIFNMDEKAYRSLNRLNYSSMSHILKSPSHYLSSLSEPRTESKAMTFGSATHKMILEPNRFHDEYLVQTVDGRTIAGKKFMLEAEMIHKKKVISDDDFSRIKRMSQKILSHDIASKLLTGGEAESVLLFELRASNGNIVKCKAKVDYLLSGMVIDLKTTSDASVAAFSKSLENFNYFLQGAFYSMGIECLTGNRPEFYFVAIESESPFALNVIKLSENHYSLGYSKVMQCVDIYEEMLRTNRFPGYPEVINESIFSKWLK